MKRQFFNFFLLLILLSGLGFTVNAQTVVVESKLQSYNLKIGDQTKLFLIVHKPINEQVTFPKVGDTIIGKVQVIKANKPDTTTDQGDKGRVTITKSYTITSFDAGTYTIPPFSFGAATGVLKTNELSLTVQTVKVDTTKAFYDIKQPLAVSYTFFDWLRDHWIWVVSVLVILALIAGLIYYLRKRPKNEPIIQIIKPVLPIHTIAINKLRELRAQKLWQKNEVKRHHSELTDIVREYLEKRYNIKTHEKTTDEILSALRSREITDEYRGLLKQVLVLADLVKFAKEIPSPTENERSVDDSIEFILKTQLDTPGQPTTDGGSADAAV